MNMPPKSPPPKTETTAQDTTQVTAPLRTFSSSSTSETRSASEYKAPVASNVVPANTSSASTTSSALSLSSKQASTIDGAVPSASTESVHRERVFNSRVQTRTPYGEDARLLESYIDNTVDREQYEALRGTPNHLRREITTWGKSPDIDSYVRACLVREQQLYNAACRHVEDRVHNREPDRTLRIIFESCSTVQTTYARKCSLATIK
jgi:hypothetical protein